MRRLAFAEAPPPAPPGASTPGGEVPVVLVVRLAGAQDAATAPGLHARLQHLLTAHPTRWVAVDLGGVTSMDRAGVQPLLAAQRRLGGALQLRAVPPCVRPVLDASGFGRQDGPLAPPAAGAHSG
jgi:anti-anti-sigma factor